MFTGYTDQTVDVFWGIRFNNDRAWFAEHKQEFQDAVMAPTKALAAELYDDVRVGYQPLHGKSRRVDLLNKSDSARLSHSHSGGPGHGQDRVARARYVLLYLFQQSERALGYLREMALVGFVYYIILIVEHDAFERRRPDVKSDSHVHDHTFRINLQC